MSSKKKGKSVAKKAQKFLGEEAKLRFERLKSTPLIYERGFHMEKKAWSLGFALQIRALQWETFCHPRSEAILPWVYEFYANAKQIEGDSVMVRGRSIDISEKVINELYELGDMEDLLSMDQSFDPMEVAALICCAQHPEWTNSSMRAIKSTSLSREAKAWLLFINASIMPTRHLNNVTADRAILIYNIMKGNRVNVGNLINYQLKLKIKESKPRLLWFPILITELCRKMGVIQHPDDLITHFHRHITERVVEVNIKVGNESDIGLSTPKKGSMGSSSSAGEKFEDVYCGTGDGATLFDILTNIEYLKSHQHCQHRYFRSRLDRIEGKINNMQKKKKTLVEEDPIGYEWQFNERGALLDGNGDCLDPTEYVDSEKEKDDDAEQDEENEDEDGDD